MHAVRRRWVADALVMSYRLSIGINDGMGALPHRRMH
jgi:hypothetical protein